MPLMYSQGCLDPRSQLLLLLPRAAGGSQPEKLGIALPGCIVLLPPASQKTPTVVRLLGFTSVLQPASIYSRAVSRLPWLFQSATPWLFVEVTIQELS